MKNLKHTVINLDLKSAIINTENKTKKQVLSEKLKLLKTIKF